MRGKKSDGRIMREVIAWLIFAASAAVTLTLAAVGIFWSSWRGRDIFVAMLLVMAALLAVMSILNSAADIGDARRARKAKPVRRIPADDPLPQDVRRAGYVSAEQVCRAAKGGRK